MIGMTNASTGASSHSIVVTVGMDNPESGDLKDFKIVIRQVDSGQEHTISTSDDTGVATITGIAGDVEYLVTASKDGFVQASGTVTTTELETTLSLTTEYATYEYSSNGTHGSAESTVDPKYKTNFSIKIEPITGYDYPKTISKFEIKDVASTRYTYSSDTGVLTVLGTDIIGNIYLEFECPPKQFKFTASLEHGSVSSASGTATFNSDLKIGLTADTYYDLPTDLTVKIGDRTGQIATDYTIVNGTLTILGTVILGDIVVTGKCTPKKFSLTYSIEKGKLPTESAVITYTEDYETTITPNDYYDLPETITMNRGGTKIVEGFQYDTTTGKITIDGSAIINNMQVVAVCTPKKFEYSVTVENGKADKTTGECQYTYDFTTTITPDTDFNLPKAVTVKRGTTTLSDTLYTWDADKGILTIPGKEIIDDIEITVTCKPDSWVYSLTIDESNSSTSDSISLGDDCVDFGKCAGSSAGTFTITDGWANAEIIKDIAPYAFDGASWTALDKEDESNWPTNPDCFTEIPAFYYGISKEGTIITVKMSDQPFTGSCRDAFLASDGVTVNSNTHIGCFYASGDETGIYSQAGRTPKVTMALNKYWVGANARGAEYDCFPFQQLVVLQILYLLMFQDTNCQTAFARGYVDSHSAVKSNTLWTYTNSFGMAGTAGTDDGKGMSFFWVHDLWGNMYQFIASIFTRAGSSLEMYQVLGRMADPNMWTDSSWNSTSNYAKQANIGITTGSTGKNLSNYYTKACGTNGAGFIISSDSGTGTASTYWPDSGYVTSNTSYAAFLLVGGGYNDSDYAGLFCARVSVRSTISDSYHGSRLSYRGGRT